MTVAADTSNLALSSDDEDKNGGGTNALERIKQEAQQVSSFRRRGVRNVTAEFRKASSQLLPGQLVKDEAFTLFEAVGALEVSGLMPFANHNCSGKEPTPFMRCKVCADIRARSWTQRWTVDMLLQ